MPGKKKAYRRSAKISTTGRTEGTAAPGTPTNLAGGIMVKGQKYNIELTVHDDKFTAEADRTAMERLLYQDKARFLINTMASPTIVAGLSLVKQEKVLNLTAGTRGSGS
jgi:ABC-type branched-subunit amino acid transport system substrate-binding protein